MDADEKPEGIFSQAVTERMKVLQQRVRSAQVVTLPLWPDAKRGTPNSFLRSALFAAIQSKDRSFLKEATLASQKNVVVKYTGEQLNQEDLSVWEALTHLARQHPLGHSCDFSANQLLKGLGLHTGKSQHTQLHSTIVRLTACAVEITQEDRTYVGSLIEGAYREDNTGRYCVRLNDRLIALFGENQWTAMDWQQRQQLRGKHLAQALHAFYSSHRRPYPLKVETLRGFVGSQNQQKAGFKAKLRIALQELVNIGFLSGFSIDHDLVSVTRSTDPIQPSLLDEAGR